MAVQSLEQESADPTEREKVWEHLCQVTTKGDLPALPVVVTKVLGMLENPDLDMRVLCRVLSDDASLAARILAIARSAYYGQRTLPTTLLASVQVMGLRDLRNVIVSIATHGLFKSSGPVADALWSHSLAVALAARVLSSAAGLADPEQAFLAGLLHDIGEMVFLQRDKEEFSRIAREAGRNQTRLVEAEQALYNFDHAVVGAMLLESWNIDAEIGRAVLTHHGEGETSDPQSLRSVIIVADYVAFMADLGFYAPTPVPAPVILRAFVLDNDEVLAQAVEEVRHSFDAECALLKAT